MAKRKPLTAQQLENIRGMIETFEYPSRLEECLRNARAEMNEVADTLEILDCPAQAGMLRSRVAQIDELLN